MCVCVFVCGAPHPSVDVHLILQIIRCSERYYEPGKFHGRGEYRAHATYKLCLYIRNIYERTYVMFDSTRCLIACIVHTYVRTYVFTYML